MKNLAGLYAAAGFGLTLVKPLAGGVLIQESSNRATEVVYVARHYPQMMAWLEKLIDSNDMVNLAIGHGIMAFAMLVAADRITMGERTAQILAQFGYGELVNIKLQGVHHVPEAAAA